MLRSNISFSFLKIYHKICVKQKKQTTFSSDVCVSFFSCCLYVFYFFVFDSFYCLFQRSCSVQKLEEAFAQQLEEQERIYGPVTPLVLPSDLPDFNPGSKRSSFSSDG